MDLGVNLKLYLHVRTQAMSSRQSKYVSGANSYSGIQCPKISHLPFTVASSAPSIIPVYHICQLHKYVSDFLGILIEQEMLTLRQSLVNAFLRVIRVTRLQTFPDSLS